MLRPFDDLDALHPTIGFFALHFTQYPVWEVAAFGGII
jgi:hypothetical protein